MSAVAVLPDDRGLSKPSTQVQRRRAISGAMRWVLLAATLLSLFALGVLLWTIIGRGWDWLSWHLITDMPSRKPEIAGLNSALWGTIWVVSLTILIAFPVGVGAAIFLEEYGSKTSSPPSCR